MDKDTVIYVGGFELPDKNAAAHRVLSIGKALRDYGYNVVYLSVDKELTVSDKSAFKVIDGFDVWFSKYPKDIKQWIEYITYHKDIYNVIQKYKNVSAVIFYNPPALALINLSRYCRSNGMKLFSDCTEWHTTSYLSGIKRIVKFFDINLSLRYAQKRIDGIIAISSFFEKHFQKNNVIRVIPMIDKKDAKWSLSKEDIKPTKDCTAFVYAGNMGDEKDRLNKIICSFGNLKNKKFQFDIVGIAKEDYLRKFPEHKQIIDNMESNIKFHGKLPHKEALEYIKKAHFSFLIRENIRKNNAGFPTKFGECIACGTPVISTHFSDVKEYVEKFCLGIMVASTDEIDLAIQKAINMSDKDYSKLRQSCIKCNVFDYRNYINPLGSFIENTVRRIK